MVQTSIIEMYRKYAQMKAWPAIYMGFGLIVALFYDVALTLLIIHQITYFFSAFDAPVRSLLLKKKSPAFNNEYQNDFFVC